MNISAIVLVGISKRLEKKHLLKLGDRTIIEIVVENLKSFHTFEEIYVYTALKLKIENVVLIRDRKKNGPFASFYEIFKDLDNPSFLFGGDMPFIKKSAVDRIIEQYKGNSVVPRWKNGYLEPLHSLYASNIFNDKIKDTMPMYRFIQQINPAYVEAELLDPLTFFNINTSEDLEKARSILST